MSPRRHGRQAIFIGTPPDDWKPSSPWSVPPSLSNVTCYEKNLPMPAALGFCRAHNKKYLQTNQPGRPWAIVSRHLQARRPGEHPDATAGVSGKKPEGGDA